MSKTMIKLMEVRRSLDQEQRLSDLWQEFSLLWQGLGWQQTQLRLWLAVLPGIKIVHSENNDLGYQIAGERQAGDGLPEAIFSLISEVGRPIPIAQLKSQLSASLLATEPMIKVAVKKHPKLVIMGPVVKIK